MIDLHIHSIYSDGSCTVQEILQEAQKKKLEVISITDHDKVDAYKELATLNIKKYFSGKIIPGCEFKCYFKEHNLPIEILGYGINIEKIQEYSKEKNIAKIQDRYLQHLKKIGKQIGLHFDENLKIDEKVTAYASEIFQNEILKYPENKSILEKHHVDMEPNFYRAAQCNKNSIFYIDEEQDFIKVDELLEIIHDANGLAFLAHPYIYKIDNTEKMVEDLVQKYKIDGIESYYSTFSAEQTKTVVEICNKYNLFCSGGSDFHGIPKPDTGIGTGKGNLRIEKRYIENWITNISNIID